MWLAAHGEGSVELIARGVRARATDVRRILLGKEFVRDQSPLDRGDGPVVFRLAFFTRDGHTTSSRPLQIWRVLAILSDGDWHSRAEFITAGVGQPNSRLTDLRSPQCGGHEIEKKWVAGINGYLYRLANGPLFVETEVGE